ncbi:8642_t:CDS:10 [Dentiscutata erythropus]|uniref:8642_t:CDS:1 n=1 Tax=Dentiscutata erythropus TaxID=1348616 RepID=A0A9N8Z0N1_9GLOM|nr:8642_t:CDS:10 [Dentiscutata erythropus]
MSVSSLPKLDPKSDDMNKTKSNIISKTLKKAVSMDSLHQRPSGYVKKRNGSLDVNLCGSWFTKHDHKSTTNEQQSSDLLDETFVVALIGKPSVGKSTIVRTGLNNLAPIRNVGVEQNILHAPTLITEIEVDDRAYPVEVLEIQENVFDMKAPLRWPKELPDIDGILVCYDVTSRASIANIAWLLNAFKEFQIPTILVANKADCPPTKRQVDTEYGSKLAPLFDVGFVELDTRTNHGIQKIHNVFSMLLKLSIRHREFKEFHICQEIKSESVDLSSDSLYLQSIVGDVDSEKLSSHRRTTSDLSHESRGRGRFSNFSAVRYMKSRYHNRFGSSKARSPLNRLSSDDEGSSSTRRSLSRSPFSSSPSVSVTPSNTPPKSSVLSQVSLPSFLSHSDRSSYRRSSFLPSSTLLQVMEAEEEKDIVIVRTGHSRTSCGSYDSTASSMSAISDNSWEGLLFVNDPLGPNKCTGNRSDGATIDELIQRLTCVGGQYGTHDDPFTITFFVVYRAFMRPRDVLIKLMKKFEECEQDSIDRRNSTHEKICNLLYHWITQHPHDLIHPQTRQLMREFFETISSCSHLSYYSIILNPLINGTVPENDPDMFWGLVDITDEKLIKKHGVMNITPHAKKDSGFGGWTYDNREDNQSETSDTVLSVQQSSNRTSSQPHHKSSLIIVPDSSIGRPMSQLTFDELSEKDIANELTFQEFQLFKKISGRDLLRHIWAPQGSVQRGNGRVAKSIQHFNFISNWVSTMILSQEKLKNRAAMLKKFMKIAVIVRELNNYNTLMAIIAAINSSPITRLRRTRELLKGKSSYKKFHNLEVLMSTDKSFGNYRMALKAPSRGHDEQKGIPYLNFQDDGRVHWNKFALMGDVLNMIRKFQKPSYNIKSNTLIEKFIADTTIMNDDDLYKKSLELEPRVQRAASEGRLRR